MDNVWKQDPSLFIWLGLDTLYSIKLKLLVSKESNEGDLRIVFSHATHKQSEQGKNYPLGMGLFVQDSKLHFFGGENIAPNNNSFSDINFEMGMKPGDQSRFIFNETFLFNPPKWGRPGWINKEVFKFNPILNDQSCVLITPDKSTPLIPNHTGYKVRPIVVTISGKVYALATKPYMGSLVEACLENDQFVFEVFEPKSNGKGHWEKLPDPPTPLLRAILGYPDAHGVNRKAPMVHFVIRNKLFLLGNCGDFLFDVVAGKWDSLPYTEELDDIGNLATLEYKNHLLVFLNFMLLDLSSFGEFEGSFGSSESILGNTVYDIRDDVALSHPITATSLSRVDNNCICLVFITFLRLYVCLLQVIENPSGEVKIKVKFKANRVFHLPRVLISDPYILSTFQLPRAVDPGEEYVGKSNKDSREEYVGKSNKDPREEYVGKSKKNVTDPREENQENQGSTGGSNSVILVRNLPPAIPTSVVLVRNLPPAVTTSDILLKKFTDLKFGKIKPGRVFLNRMHHFAFVEFEDIQSLNEAIKASPIHFDEKKVYIEKADNASMSCSSWWKREQRKALKGRH